MTAREDEGGNEAGNFGVLVVAHGELPGTLLKVVEKILGAALEAEAVSVGWDDEVGTIRRKIEEAVKKANRGRGVLILTDMFGGTPSNIALSFHDPGKVDVVTGVNLPMIIKIASQKEGETLASLARIVRDQGRSSIAMASDFLTA